MRCGACGYFLDVHDAITRKCPIETADKNGRRGAFRAPAPPAPPRTWRQIMHDDAAARAAAYDAAHRPYMPEPVRAPQVPARAPRGPAEIAGYQGKQAVGLGRRAVAAGWRAAAYYWRAHDGVEGCAVKLIRGDLFAVATWTRQGGRQGSGSGWKADIAYGVQAGEMPIKINHSDLERIISD